MSQSTLRQRLAERTLRIRGGHESPYFQIMRKVEGRDDIIRLVRGEPDIPTPPHIIEAAKRCLDTGHVGYTPPGGMIELREAIARKFKEDNNLDYDADSEILVTAGAQESMAVSLQTLLDPGDEVLLATPHYMAYPANIIMAGGHIVYVDTVEEENFELKPEAIEAAITDRTKLVYGETIGNPRGELLDMEPIADLAHSHGIPLMIDNTFASPWLCRPFEWGADIVVHSATKFIGGHGVVIAGVIVESGRFRWDNGNFGVMTAPSPAYHGLRFWENFREYAYLTKARAELLRDVGAAISPFNSFLLLMGLETLPIRMERHVENAHQVAVFLRDHPAVSWVSYPIFSDSPGKALAEKYTPAGPGAVFTFGLARGFAAGVRFIESVRLASHLANVGDTKTLVIHPASTTHQQLSPQARAAAGVGDDTIRISVGLEDIEDILADLDGALSEANRV